MGLTLVPLVTRNCPLLDRPGVSVLDKDFTLLGQDEIVECDVILQTGV